MQKAAYRELGRRLALHEVILKNSKDRMCLVESISLIRKANEKKNILILYNTVPVF